MTASLLGTMGWCESAGGRLNETEKIAFARNVASLKAEMSFDELRS